MTSSAAPHRRATKAPRDAVYPAQWFPLTVPAHESEPTPEQWAFVEEARALFLSLNPVRAANTWAVLYGGMILVVPLDRRNGMQLNDRGSLHTSLQLLMRERQGGPVILGAWHDSHYAWDYEPKPPDFEGHGHDADTRGQALDWLAREMRRPISRSDTRVFGVTIGSEWRYADAGHELVESRGFLPLVWLLHGRRGNRVPAGYFDPW